MKTTTVKEPASKWVLIDAEGQNLGRLAARVAFILRGKHRATFSAHKVSGDNVIVINAAKLKFHPTKLFRKQYVSHSGYLGHMSMTSLERMMEKKPTSVIERAVRGMLPANRLRPTLLKRLHVYADAAHNHEAQKPEVISATR